MMKYAITLIFAFLALSLQAEEGFYNVKDYGASGDGVSLSTSAIQEAIDVCAENGGGKVIVPAGKYLSGPLFLKSNISVEIFPGAVLIFDDDIKNCPIVEGRWEGIERRVYASLFTGHNLENITITGRGMIDGKGEKWWEAHYENKALRKKHGLKGREPDNPAESPLKAPRPRLINLYNCTNVLISELTLVNSPAWTIHPVYCENVVVEKISIIQPYESPNTDGINPESCKNVRILNCFVDCGDDCITIKSGYNEDGRRVGRSCENIVISNCTFAHGRSAIGIGSEMSGDVRNVSISNCVFNGTLRGIRIKTGRGRGGIVENYRADNIVMMNVKTAISIDMYYGNKDTTAAPVTVETPVFRNIHLSNITAVNVEKAAEIRGLPESPVQDFSITNSSFNAGQGFEVRYAKQLRLENIIVNTQEGSSLEISRSSRVEIDNSGSDTPLDQEPVIMMEKCDDVYIHSCNPVSGTGIFLKSVETENLELGNNRLQQAKIVQQ
jgi:polygalacturonase